MADTEEDRRRAEIRARLHERTKAADERRILAEYRRLGIEPIRAGEFLLTPSLVAIVKGIR